MIELILLVKIKQRLPRQDERDKKSRTLFPLGFFQVVWKLGSSALSRSDLYTDLLFVVILYDCIDSD